MIPNLPKQKVSHAEKTKNDDEWGKKCIDSFIDNSKFGGAYSDDLLEYYSIYNGEMNESKYYSYVTNPLNSNDPKRKNFPARIRNYNIIKPVIDLLMGEKNKRPFNYTVVCKNSDVINQKKQAESAQIMQILQQMFINELNNQGVDTGQQNQEVPQIQEFIKLFGQNYNDGRAILGQEALDYIIDNVALEDKFLKGFFDWCITGEVYSYKGIDFDDVQYELVSPLEIDYSKTSDVDYVEEADWVVRKKTMSLNSVIDTFYEDLDSEMIDQLENEASDLESEFNSLFFNSNAVRNGSNRFVDVYHVVWKTFQEVGILTYKTNMGTVEQMEVSRDYKFNEETDIDIEWFWINALYHGYRIGRDNYLRVGYYPVQRMAMDNLSKVKLPYNGKCYSNRHADNISPLKIGIPFQVLYNIFHFRLELTMAKNKDKLLIMEYNMVPREHGWDETDVMYMADATSIVWVDSTNRGANDEKPIFNQITSVDMSLWQYITKNYELLQAIKEEWEESLGVTRQRKGQINSSDGKSVTERAVFQSSVISEEFFRRYGEFEKSELQGLLDTSKFAWINGKKASYINRDFRPAFMSINPPEYMESEFGVFVHNQSKEIDKLNMLRSFGIQNAQSMADPYAFAEILDSNNFAKIKTKLSELKEAERQFQAQQQETQKEIEQMKMQQQQMQMQFTADEAQKDRDLQRELKMMDIEQTLWGQDLNQNGQLDVNEIEKRALDREKFFADLREKQQDRKQKMEIEEKKLKVQEKKIDIDLKIAKTNRNKYSK